MQAGKLPWYRQRWSGGPGNMRCGRRPTHLLPIAGTVSQSLALCWLADCRALPANRSAAQLWIILGISFLAVLSKLTGAL